MQRNSELTYDGITEHIIINEFDLYDNLYTYVNNILKNVITISKNSSNFLKFYSFIKNLSFA